MGKLIVRIASLLLIAAFLPTAVLAAEWNLENGSIEITAAANPEGKGNVNLNVEGINTPRAEKES